MKKLIFLLSFFFALQANAQSGGSPALYVSDATTEGRARILSFDGGTLTDNGNNYFTYTPPAGGAGYSLYISKDSVAKVNNASDNLFINFTNGIRLVNSGQTLSVSIDDVQLTSDIVGILPIANGGTGAIDGYTIISNDIDVLNSGAVIVSNDVGDLKLSTTILSNDATSYLKTVTVDAPLSGSGTSGSHLVIAANSSTSAGTVLSGAGQNAQVWKTDASGNPGWRADATGGAGYSTYISKDGAAQANSATNNLFINFTNGLRFVTSGQTLHISVDDVQLTSDVAGILPIANGGTNSIVGYTVVTNDIAYLMPRVNALSGDMALAKAAKYIVQTADTQLTAEQALSSLSTGIMYVTNSTGVITSLGNPLPIINGGTASTVGYTVVSNDISAMKLKETIISNDLVTLVIGKGGTGSTIGFTVVTNDMATYKGRSFITKISEDQLTNEQPLSALSTGFAKITTGTGAVSTVADPLPVANGGTASTIGYTVVSNDVSKIKTDIIIISNDATTYLKSVLSNSPLSGSGTASSRLSITVNSVTADGVVTTGSGQNSKVWKTDAGGVPGWRTDETGEPGAGDVSSVGDCDTGACFAGATGTTLIFNNAGGDGTISYDGVKFVFNKPLSMDVVSYIAGNKFSKSFIITNPTASADSSVWRSPAAVTITAVHLLCRGNVVEGHLTEQDANGGSDAGVDGATDITGVVDTNVSDDGTRSNPSIDSGDYVGWRTTSVTGTPTKAIVTFEGYWN